MRHTHAPTILALLVTAALVAGPIVWLTLAFLTQLSDALCRVGIG